jgi:hypothetical protein
MPEQVHPRRKNYGGTSPTWSWLVLLTMAALASGLVLHAILFGPAMRERADRLRAQEVDREDRALCERLGMPQGSARFTACAAVLSEARREEAMRLASELAGIL